MTEINKNYRLTIFCLTTLFGSLVAFEHAYAAPHAAGTNVVDQGTIYMITDNGYRRPYTSAGAYLSYGFNSWANAVTANPEDMALPQGPFIPPRDGKIVCSDRGGDKGTCYLITSGKRAAFVSAQVFQQLGFSFSKAIYGDVSFMERDRDITTSAEQHRSGVLINKAGTIFLVSANGTLGIPSMEVLNTWGYSLDDVVTANASDTPLAQTSVIASRQGAKLSPLEVVPAPQLVSESALLQGYIDTHPDLPTVAISAPQDAAAAIETVQRIEVITDPKIESVYPHMTSKSVEMLNRMPQFRALLLEPSVSLVGMSQISSNIQIFQDGATGLYSQTKKQRTTDFTKNSYWVLQKENNAWKWDYIGTIKYLRKISEQQNPMRSYTLGTGTNDISIAEASYTSQPMVSDTNTYLLVLLKNNGQTTIEKFTLTVRFNTVVVTSDDETYQLRPGQSVIVAVPIDYYWSLLSVQKTPGSYPTEIVVGFGAATTDANTRDNTFNFNTTFQQNTSTPAL